MVVAKLNEQKQSLEFFYERFDIEPFQVIVKKLAECKGAIILTGIGKSSYIAQKVSASLISVGIRSFFLCPSHALHGDIGIVRKEDHLIVLSKSGETKELLDLCTYIQKRGSSILSVVSQKNSSLEKLSDKTIYLPLDQELCPHKQIPTTSSVLQLLFGDLLVVSLMEEREVKLSDFARNHPGGLIGQRISVRVSDVMIQGESLPICGPESTLLDVLPLLSEKRSGCILICDEHLHLQGIFTDGDLRRSLEEKGRDILKSPICKLMTVKAKTVDAEMLSSKALQMMEEDFKSPVTVLPVLKDRKVIGLLRMHDILQKNLR